MPTPATIPPAVVGELAVGQTRACLSADPARALHVTIGKIESFGSVGPVVSVTLYNTAPGSPLPGLAHAPIDAKVLVASCPSVERQTLPLSPNFEGGYAEWRKANGGVFTISVDQIYDVVLAQVAQARQGGLNVQ